jgi:hypothetical protein
LGSPPKRFASTRARHEHASAPVRSRLDEGPAEERLDAEHVEEVCEIRPRRDAIGIAATQQVESICVNSTISAKLWSARVVVQLADRDADVGLACERRD